MPEQKQTNNKEVDIEEVANGQFDVQLKEMGVLAEDIAAY
jgi:hypothetical protein